MTTPTTPASTGEAKGASPREVREPITHDLKTWPEYFQAVKRGDKRFEIRKNDRDFRVGDTLRLLEYSPHGEVYSGDEVSRLVSFILDDGPFAIPGCVVMSLAKPVKAANPEGEDEPRDDERETAWSDFEGDHLTDGSGYAAADVYRRCRAAFDASWPQGREAAMRASSLALANAINTPPAPSKAEKFASHAKNSEAPAIGDGWKPTHRHKVRGTSYEIVGTAVVQIASDVVLEDEEEVIVYRGEDGRMWARPEPEFYDGRFEPLAAAPTPDSQGEGR